MERRIKTCAMAAVLVCVCLLASCNKYVSHYSALGLVRTNTARSAYMSFHSLEGVVSFRLKCKKASEGRMKYSASLESGSVMVFYEASGTRTELFTLGAGEEVSSYLDELEPGTIYVIVETDEPCQKGAFHFDME